MLDSNRVTGTNGFGGGLFTYTFATQEQGAITISNSTVSNNTSTLDGGGIRSIRSYLELEGSTVSGNVANRDGGAIHVALVTKMNLINSTISGNSTTTGNTAGIFASRTTMTIANSTVTANSAAVDVGGMLISSYTTVTLANSIIAGNMASSGNGREVYASNFNTNISTFVTPAPNLLGNSAYNELMAFGLNAVPDASANLVGTSDQLAIPSNTIFSSLGDNGGQTLTHALVKNSPALNVGDCSVNGTNLDQDQLGQARRDICDLGSVEVNDSSCFVVPTGNGETVIFCL